MAPIICLIDIVDILSQRQAPDEPWSIPLRGNVLRVGAFSGGGGGGMSMSLRLTDNFVLGAHV